jgi:hypothetical protein
VHLWCSLTFLTHQSQMYKWAVVYCHTPWMVFLFFQSCFLMTKMAAKACDWSKNIWNLSLGPLVLDGMKWIFFSKIESFDWLIDWLIDWCLTPTLTVFQSCLFTLFIFINSHYIHFVVILSNTWYINTAERLRKLIF